MLLLFCSLFALCQATNVFQTSYFPSTGVSQQYRSQDASGNYRFGYDETHSSGGTFRDETGDSWGNKYGSYGLREADGRYRHVNYVADAQGFRAEVKSNEPGVVPKDPASTSIKTVGTVNTVKTVGKPVLYSAPAPVVHHTFNPEYPLLYQTPYQTPYYAPYGYYKGTPFRRYGTDTWYSKKGSPVITPTYSYYIYP